MSQLSVVWLVPLSDHFFITIMTKQTEIKKNNGKEKEVRVPLYKGTKIRLLKNSNKHFNSYGKGDIGVILYEDKRHNKENKSFQYIAIIRREGKVHWNFSRHASRFIIQESEFEVIKPINKNDNSKTLICEVCDKRKEKDLFKKYKGFLICDSCFNRHFLYCRDCDSIIPKNEACFINRNDNDNDIVCQDCANKNYLRCGGCEILFPIDDIHNGMCEPCREDYNENHNIIVPDNNRFVDKSIQNRDLPIGVEIEAELDDSEDYTLISRTLRRSGCGVCEDGSLNMGIEIQVPASNGGMTERLVNNACRVLKRHCYITNTCGLHVHIGYPADLTALKNAIIMAYVSEPIFYGVNPRSREYSRYCLPIRRDFALKEILNVKPNTIDKLLYSRKFGEKIGKKTIEAYKREKYNSCKYAGFNLHSHFYRGTLEFRYHSGTLDPVKIMNWANLLKTILIYAKKDFIKKNVLEVENSKSYEERSGRLFNLIGLSGDLKQYFIERYNKFNKKKKEIDKKINSQPGATLELNEEVGREWGSRRPENAAWYPSFYQWEEREENSDVEEVQTRQTSTRPRPLPRSLQFSPEEIVEIARLREEELRQLGDVLTTEDREGQNNIHPSDSIDPFDPSSPVPVLDSEPVDNSEIPF